MKEFMAANPCPFCGAISEPELGISFVDPTMYGCFVCEVFATREVWDNRPIEDVLRKRIVELAREDKQIADNILVMMDILEVHRNRIAELEVKLLLILDHVDYTNGACVLNEMIGAVLPPNIIAIVKESLKIEKEVE